MVLMVENIDKYGWLAISSNKVDVSRRYSELSQLGELHQQHWRICIRVWNPFATRLPC